MKNQFLKMNPTNKKAGKILMILLISQLNCNFIFSQSSFKLEIIYSPTIAELAYNRSKSRLLHSFGIGGKINFKSNIFISSGLYSRRLGNKLNASINTDLLPAFPSGQILTYELKYMTSSIDIPISLGYCFLKKKKLSIGIELGVNNGTLLSQKSRISLERTTRNIRVYNKYLLSIIGGIEFNYEIKEKISVIFSPAFFHQINKNRIPQKQRAIIFDIGLAYKLQ